MNNRGQGLIELVMAIGVIGLVITGVISLMVTSLHSRTSGFDRKKAAELGQKQIELLIEAKKQDPETFWNRTNMVWGPYDNISRVEPAYPNYSYVKNAIWNVACVDCVTATVAVGWSGSGIGETVGFTRLFTRN